MPAILELVTFRLVPGTDPDAFLAANDAIDAFLGAQPGFVGRTLAQDGDGTWVDTVHWTDLAAAEAAAAAFPHVPGVMDAMALMEQDGMSLRHCVIRRTVVGPATGGMVGSRRSS
jgi:hypothetical protein